MSQTASQTTGSRLILVRNSPIWTFAFLISRCVASRLFRAIPGIMQQVVFRFLLHAKTLRRLPAAARGRSATRAPHRSGLALGSHTRRGAEAVTARAEPSSLE